MPKIIKIEGFGNVAFPDTMDDAAISHAIETDILARPGVAKNVPGTVANTAAARIAARSAQSSVPQPDGPGPVRRFLQGAGVPTSVPEMQSMEESIDPAVQLTRGNPLALAGPVGLAAGSMVHTIGAGIGDQTGQALDAAQQRDAGGYLRHFFGAAVPLIGPQLAEGNVAGAMGTATALLAPMGLGKLARLRSAVPLPPELPEIWNGGEPSGSMPVHGESVTSSPTRISRVGEYAAREVASKLPVVGTHVGDLIKGSIATRRTSVPVVGEMDLSKPAAYGNAPTQPLIQPKTIGPEYDPRTPSGQYISRKSIPLVGDRQSTVPIDGFGPTSSPEATAATPPRIFRTTNGVTHEIPSPQWIEEHRSKMINEATDAGRISMSSTVPTLEPTAPAPTETAATATTVPPSSSFPSSAPDNIVGEMVRFSRGASRSHGTVLSVKGDIARVATNRLGASVRVPVAQLTILKKPTTAPTTSSVASSTVPSQGKPPLYRRSNLTAEFPPAGQLDENDDMFMRREDENGQDLQFPVPIPPSRLLPAQFKSAHNVRWGSPLSGSFPERPSALGKFGQDFDHPNIEHGPGDFANTAQISKSGTEEPATYAHELNHAIYERDLPPAQKQQFKQAVADVWEKGHEAFVKDYESGKPDAENTYDVWASAHVPAAVRVHVSGKNDELGTHEAFAELGAQYMLNPSAFKAKYPDWYGMMKQFYGGKEYVRAR